MYISSMIVIALMLVFVFFQSKNKVTAIFSICILSTAMITITAAVYISKVAAYSYISEFDYRLFGFFSKLQISWFTLVRLYNVSMALYMVSSCMMFKEVCELKNRYFIIMLVIIGAFVYLNDPLFTWKIKLLTTEPEYRILGIYFAKLLHGFNEIVIVFFAFCIEIMVFIKSLKTNLYFKREYLIAITLSLLFLSSYLYFSLIHGAKNMINFSDLAMTKFPKTEVYGTAYVPVAIAYPFVVIVSIGIMMFLNPFNELSFDKKKLSLNNMMQMNKNTSSLLHTYKNAFCSVNYIADILDESRENNDVDSYEKCINMLRKLSNEQILSIKKMLNMLKNPQINYENVDVAECILAAIKKIGTKCGVDIKINNALSNPIVVGDSIYLTEAFYNMLDNAFDSMMKKYDNPNDMKLDINLRNEEGYCVVSIADNGIGISKSEFKNIFKMFYSTKKRITNSGIGLHSVEVTVQHHNGYIKVESKENEYAKFTVFLPSAE